MTTKQNDKIALLTSSNFSTKLKIEPTKTEENPFLKPTPAFKALSNHNYNFSQELSKPRPKTKHSDLKLVQTMVESGNGTSRNIVKKKYSTK